MFNEARISPKGFSCDWLFHHESCPDRGGPPRDQDAGGADAKIGHGRITSVGIGSGRVIPRGPAIGGELQIVGRISQRDKAVAKARCGAAA